MDSSATPEVVAEVQAPVEEMFIADPKKHAFVTWVIHGDKYVTGALVLGYSLRKQGTKASLVCLVSSDVSEQAVTELKTIFDEVKVVPVINVKVPQKRRNDKDFDSKIPILGQMFTKLHALRLTQFEKIALLDADELCLTFPDNIFACQAPSGICPSLIRPDGSNDNQIITPKLLEAAVKKNGIRGCTYVLKPSEADFERAIKMITIKPKIVQYKLTKEDTMSAFRGTKSAFALLDDSEDEEEEEVKKPVVQPKSQKTVITLTAEDIARMKLENGDDETVTYPYEVYTHESAPLGFQYGEGKKSSMTYDEMLFVDLYKNKWRHLSDKYGHTSWKKTDVPTVLCHFMSEHPFTRIYEWADFDAWDATAIELAKENADIGTRLFENVPNLKNKAEGLPLDFTIVKPAPVKVKKVKETAPATADAEATKEAPKEEAAVEETVKPVDEAEAPAPVFVPAKPVASVWGKI